ncbi:hypothetical protein LSH36_74g02088 [Paralvinella palmiformis]|uniref:Coiled-coil domain-containing protein 125 n=1 Tax=Paralvinella palmiformis TaxID=53620 RepID=A0AAD9NE16_9ANNE|nr:hypothetical protein LSH36_74g02088 [Paralvinella palmiformis]
MDRLSADSYSVLDSGDLGLGRGWKPGGIYESDSDDESPCCTSDCKQDHNVNDRCSCKAGACSDEEVGHFAKLTHGRLSNALKKIRNASNSSEKETDILKQELDNCQKELDSKCHAVSILSKEAMLSKDKATEFHQEINKLQFELDYKQTNFMNSQQLWTERYAELSEENQVLQEKLETSSEEIKKVTNEKLALLREREELLALLDVQERERYKELKSQEQQPYGEFTSSELGVLGACQCRVKTPDPCQCAFAAANLKHEVIQLKEQIVYTKKQHRESLLTTDAYRTAFDEQLNRNKKLVRQLAEVTATVMTNHSKTAKFKAAMKWLLQQLNEDLPPPLIDENTQEVLTEERLEEKTENDLIFLLVDVVSDKNELVAHQRLANKLMADRCKELEEKLKTLTGEDVQT